MTLLCLIHGSTQNSRCWQWVTPRLERAGYRCLTVDLTDAVAAPSLGDFADGVASAVPEPPVEPVVVVGHSISGVFLPMLADRRPVAGLVYLAAVVPKPGKSLLDRVAEEPDMFHHRWIEESRRWNQPAARPALAVEFLFRDCGPRQVRAGTEVLDSLDVTSLVQEPYPIVPVASVPSSYIVCSRDRTLNPDWCRRVAWEELGVRPVEIATGHCPHVCHPDLLPDVLTSELRRLTGS